MKRFLFKHIADMVTIARIALTTWMNYIVWFDDMNATNLRSLLVLAIIVGPTDGLDGWIARKLGITSKFGGYLDEIADKYYTISLFSFFLLLSWNFRIFFSIDFLFVLVLFIEALLILIYIKGFIDGIDTSPSKFGKWKTTFQFIAIPWLFAIRWLEVQGVDVSFFTHLGLIIFLISTIVCGAFSILNYCQRANSKEKEV